jgi:hypothetical protein
VEPIENWFGYSNYLQFLLKLNRFLKLNRTDFTKNHEKRPVFNDFVIHDGRCLLFPSPLHHVVWFLFISTTTLQ